jgi:CRISPR-associated protein Csm4
MKLGGQHDMPYYRINVKPKGAWETDLVSGTIWGHLAWTILYRDGEHKFKEWLNSQENNPWLISSWMPVGQLPRPHLKPSAKPDDKPSVEVMKISKKYKKLNYISENIFNQIRDSIDEKKLFEALKKEYAENNELYSHKVDSYIQPHNTINRLTGSTPDSGGLFFQDINLLTKGYGFQFFIFTEDEQKENIKNLFDIIEKIGFGANNSTGKGFMNFVISDETGLFNKKNENNRAMSLSHGVLTNEMKEPRYKQHIHFGKLGGSFANSSISPFKYPILMTKPGATFSSDLSENLFFGKILADVHHELKEIRHYAVHLPVFFTEV